MWFISRYTLFSRFPVSVLVIITFKMVVCCLIPIILRLWCHQRRWFDWRCFPGHLFLRWRICRPHNELKFLVWSLAWSRLPVSAEAVMQKSNCFFLKKTENDSIFLFTCLLCQCIYLITLSNIRYSQSSSKRNEYLLWCY